MKRLQIIIISVLFFVNTILLTSCNRSNKETNTSKNENVEKVSVRENSKSKTKNNTIIWTALIISMLANAAFAMTLSVRVDEKSKKRYSELDGKLDDLKWNMPQNVKTRIEPYKLSEADINLIVDRVLECKRLDEKESQTVKYNTDQYQQQKPQPQPATVIIKKLFASAVDANMCFMEVSEQPKDKTIYTLLLEDDYNAKFELYEDAKELVIGCEDYINGACNKLGNGNTIEGCDSGFAQKTGDGFWKVIKKANVKFV